MCDINNYEIKILEKKNPDAGKIISTQHNLEKKRFLNPQAEYFHALGITNEHGGILQSGQKKFKQVDKYIDIVSHLIAEKNLRTDAVIARFGTTSSAPEARARSPENSICAAPKSPAPSTSDR